MATGSIVADAKALAELLDAAGIPATHDPSRALALGVCVLVPPPVIDYTTSSNLYRLACLTDKPIGSLAALVDLDDLVQKLRDNEHVYPERAEPSAYALTAGEKPRPAYIVTITHP